MLKRCLVTGAAGGLATKLRPLLPQIARSVHLSDTATIDDLAGHETFEACDLADGRGVETLLDGVDGIIHLGGISTEKPFDLILNSNIVGAYNLFEAARHHGCPRIVFASTNHVTGFYRREQRLDAGVPLRPDSLYAVSKAFGEALASLYADKFGQECLSVRIGWCFPDPRSSRSRATWLAIEDFCDLCGRAFAVARLGHTIVYGASDNEDAWWDNREAGFLGWKPKHRSTRGDGVEPAEDPRDPTVIYQGGAYAVLGHPNDGKPAGPTATRRAQQG